MPPKCLDRTLGLNTVEHRLRPRRLSLQAIGRSRRADAVARFRRVEAFAAGLLGFLGGAEGSACGLCVVVGLQSSEKNGLHRIIQRRRGGAQQLARVFEAGIARTRVVQQPGERQRGAARGCIATVRALVRNRCSAVQGRQVGRPGHADFRCLHPGAGPALARLRVLTKRLVDDIKDVVGATGWMWLTRNKRRIGGKRQEGAGRRERLHIKRVGYARGFRATR